MLSLLLDQPPSVGYPILLLPSIDQSIISGIGISTDYPSLTPFDLSLGPDLPWADGPSQETLGFRPLGFSPNSRYLCQHSLLYKIHYCSRFSFNSYTTLPYQCFHSTASVMSFSPVYLRRRNSRLVSYYALFK